VRPVSHFVAANRPFINVVSEAVSRLLDLLDLPQKRDASRLATVARRICIEDTAMYQAARCGEYNTLN
jgi:hypothetical protein